MLNVFDNYRKNHYGVFLVVKRLIWYYEVVGVIMNFYKNKLVKPIVKWVGGKRQLLPEIELFLPNRAEINCYVEPFLGGGALLMYLQPSKAFVNDLNEDLINLYTVIKNNKDDLINELETYKNDSIFFYELRDLDRNLSIFDSLSDIKKAARILYLNKTCFNGLFRVNNSGQFNTPFGNYKNPNFCDTVTINALSNYFNSADIKFSNLEYKDILALIPKNKKTFVYLDPPYDPISDTSSFTGYTKSGFGKEQQIELKAFCDKLTRNGIKFLLSNSSTKFIHTLYTDENKYEIRKISAKRAINSNGNKRGAIEEVLIRNYE